MLMGCVEDHHQSPEDRGRRVEDTYQSRRSFRARRVSSEGTGALQLASERNEGAYDVEPAPDRSFFRAPLDGCLVPDENDRDTIFQEARLQGNSIYFRHLCLRKGGGLDRDVAVLEEKLFTKAKVFDVVMLFAFVAFNSYTIFSSAMRVYVHVQEVTSASFTIANVTDPFILLIDHSDEVDGYKRHCFMQFVVSLWEVACMSWMLCYSTYVIAKFNICTGEGELKHYRIWHQVFHTSCTTLTDVTNFSAMRLLERINPQMLGKAFALEWTKTEEGHSPVLVAIKFIIGLVFGGIVGFVAFAIKFSEVVGALMPNVKDKAWSVTLLRREFLILFGFINQIFGITRIWHVERYRVFLFIFGGEDSAMQAGEIDRQEAYLATVALVICQDLWVNDRWARLKRAVALLSFTDLDIQALIIDEDERFEVDANTIHERLRLRRAQLRNPSADCRELRASSQDSTDDFQSFSSNAEGAHRWSGDAVTSKSGPVTLKDPSVAIELLEHP